MGDRDLKQYITAEPDVYSGPISDRSEFLILGTDGLWDVVGNQEATALVRACLGSNGELGFGAAPGGGGGEEGGAGAGDGDGAMAGDGAMTGAGAGFAAGPTFGDVTMARAGAGDGDGGGARYGYGDVDGAGSMAGSADRAALLMPAEVDPARAGAGAGAGFGAGGRRDSDLDEEVLHGDVAEVAVGTDG